MTLKEGGREGIQKYSLHIDTGSISRTPKSDNIININYDT